VIIELASNLKPGYPNPNINTSEAVEVEIQLRGS
jgi:hypothetical protein